MFFPEGQIRVHLYGRPCDMRKSFDGLFALAKFELRQDPISGRLFVFINRRGTQMKVLYFDRSGFCIWAKRLERGKFIWPAASGGAVSISAAQMAYMLEGIDWRHPQVTWRPQSAG